MPNPLEGVLNAVNSGVRAYAGGLQEADAHHRMMDQHAQMIHAMMLQDAQEGRAQQNFPMQQRLLNAQVGEAEYGNQPIGEDEATAASQFRDRMRGPNDSSMQQPFSPSMSHRSLNDILKYARGGGNNAMAIEQMRIDAAASRQKTSDEFKNHQDTAAALKADTEKAESIADMHDQMNAQWQKVDPGSEQGKAFAIETVRRRMEAKQKRADYTNYLRQAGVPVTQAAPNVLGSLQYNPDDLAADDAN